MTSRLHHWRPSAQMMSRPTLAPQMTAATLVGASVTAFVATGLVEVTYRNAAAHLVLETAQGCVALLVAFLLYGRFSRSRRLQDLLLLQSLVLLAFAGVVLDGVVSAFVGTGEGSLDVWLPTVLRLAGVLFIAAAAVCSPRRLTSRQWRPLGVGPALTLLSVSLAALWWQATALPIALNPRFAPQDVSERLATGHPLLTASMVVAMLCFGFAAVAFTLQARNDPDELVTWLGPACALAMFARVNYVIFPSLYSDWLYAGDLLRVGFYLLLLVGAAKEIGQYWGAQTRVAVLEERRRVARELHDGVVQELGYIRTESRAFLAADPIRTNRMLGACDRALDEARQAVEALGHSGEEPLGFALHRAARQVADRYHVALELDVDDSIDAGQQERHALLRIVREAISNAARHGGAARVKIELTGGESGRVLTLVDNGAGFDVEAALSRPSGFGLTSIRERAQGLPGTLEIQSRSGAGSRITVRW